MRCSSIARRGPNERILRSVAQVFELELFVVLMRQFMRSVDSLQKGWLRCVMWPRVQFTFVHASEEEQTRCMYSQGACGIVEVLFSFGQLPVRLQVFPVETHYATVAWVWASRKSLEVPKIVLEALWAWNSLEFVVVVVLDFVGCPTVPIVVSC
jgi:hypothetical protein